MNLVAQKMLQSTPKGFSGIPRTPTDTQEVVLAFLKMHILINICVRNHQATKGEELPEGNNLPVETCGSCAR